jgi:hypothetical protein
MAAESHVNYNLKEISNAFLIEGEVEYVVPYGSGHINDTFHVKNAQKDQPDYLLQRINRYVFTNAPALINNIKLVTLHIREKMKEIEGFNPNTETLTLIPAANNLFYHLDGDGNYWRMYYFLKDTNSYDIVTTANQAYEGGKAFGRFQACLSDMDAALLVETIPDFHNIEKRIERLKQVIIDNPLNRVQELDEQVRFIFAREEKMKTILNLGRTGQLPLRITHNDTKFNNVLLDQHDQAQCVIDLDTVMPGYVAYDFGDAIRSSANTAAEDEKDLSKIDVNVEIFKAFTAGYLKETHIFLTSNEITSLTLGALLLPFLVGVRFLTDYIEGDKYFKINAPGHNLQRAKAQFQLLKKLEDNQHILHEIVLEEARKTGMTITNNPIASN